MKKTIEHYMNLDYPVLIEPFNESNFKGVRISLKDIPAIESIDITEEEAFENLKDIKYEWFAYAIEEGLDIPEPANNTKIINNLTRVNKRKVELKFSSGISASLIFPNELISVTYETNPDNQYNNSQKLVNEGYSYA